MKTILICLIILVSSICYADKYKRIESQVRSYEAIAVSLGNIKEVGEALHAKGRIIGAEYEKLKAAYNRKYALFVETAYLLEEIIIIEGGLTMDDMIVRLSDRKGSIDDIGKRQYTKTVDELIVDIDKNLKLLSDYINEVFVYYGKKQRQKKEEIQKTVR